MILFALCIYVRCSEKILYFIELYIEKFKFIFICLRVLMAHKIINRHLFRKVPYEGFFRFHG